MKFGVFYDHQLPRPWTTTSEYDLLQQSLDQFQFADQLGYDYAWVVEHHFLEEYSHSSAPEVFLGAASQRTRNIRLGHGVIQLTTNQPQRVAEKVATLDLLSGGRVDLGMGEAAGPAEEPRVPVEALTGAARQRNFRLRRQRDPLGEGHPCTWRTLLIKVAAEVIVRTRRIVIRLASSWPHLDWYRRVCERLRDPLPTPVPNPSG